LDESFVLEVITQFQSLIRDVESEVRIVAAKSLFTFCEALPDPAENRKNLTVQHIIPYLKDLAIDQKFSDPHQQVKTALASIIMKLATLIGDEHTQTHLVPLFLVFLKDECAEVRLNIIKNIECVNDVIGFEIFSQTLMPAIIELAEDSKWRVRLAILDHMPLIASKIGKKAFNEKMFDLVIACLADHVFSIRDAACRTLQRIVDIFGLDWAKQIVMPKVFQLAEEKNYLRRMTMLFQVNYLMSSTLKEKDEIAELCCQPVCTLHKDDVANVRFNVARTLGKMHELVSKKNVQNSVKPALGTDFTRV
jgi:serine/threonine-protein phosphatase 2A regulatory subunit A